MSKYFSDLDQVLDTNEPTFQKGNFFLILGRYSTLDRQSLNDSKKNWITDKGASRCLLCNEPFTTTRRRHHCRTCGLIYCSKCMQNTSGKGKENEAEQNVKTCDACFHLLSVGTDKESIELEGLKAMAANQGFSLDDQTMITNMYFAQLILNKNQMIRRLALITLVKITLANPKVDFTKNLEIYDYISNITYNKLNPLRHYAYELFSNLLSVLDTSAQNHSIIINLAGMKEHLMWLPLSFANETNAKTLTSGLRFYLNIIRGLSRKPGLMDEYVDTPQVISLLKLMANEPVFSSDNDLKVAALVYSSIYFMIKIDDNRYRQLFLDCGGMSILFSNLYKLISFKNPNILYTSSDTMQLNRRGVSFAMDRGSFENGQGSFDYGRESVDDFEAEGEKEKAGPDQSGLPSRPHLILYYNILLLSVLVRERSILDVILVEGLDILFRVSDIPKISPRIITHLIGFFEILITKHGGEEVIQPLVARNHLIDFIIEVISANNDPRFEKSVKIRCFKMISMVAKLETEKKIEKGIVSHLVRNGILSFLNSYVSNAPMGLGDLACQTRDLLSEYVRSVSP